MEDNKQSSAEEAAASSTKKTSGEFVNGWLKRKRLPLILRSRSREVTNPPEAATKESRLERIFSILREKLPRRFNRFFGVQIKPVAPESAAKSTKPDSAITSSEASSHWAASGEPEKAGAQSEGSQAEHRVFEQSRAASETAGWLPISDEAIRRYQFEQASRESTDYDGAHELKLPTVEPTAGSNAVRVREKTHVINESIDHPILPTNVMALSAGEILRRQRERRLRKEVKLLKKEALSARKERDDVMKQQQEFGRRLDEQAKRTKQIVERQLPQLETFHEATPDQTKQLEKPVTTQTEVQPSATPEVVMKSAELKSDKLKEMVATPPQRPELVRQTVEKAAEFNMPIERLYEQRHERKDKMSMAAARPKYKNSQAVLNRFRNDFSQLPSAMMPTGARSTPEAVKLPANTTEQQSIYRQAALSGFWTAVILCVFVLILIISH